MFEQEDTDGAVVDEEAKLFRVTKDNYPFSINYCEMPQMGIDYEADAKAKNAQ